MNERVQRLREAGVSIWLDTLSRALLETGEFERLMDELGISGATSNPTIFAKAITGSDRYDHQLRDLVQTGSPTRKSCSSQSPWTTSAARPTCYDRRTSRAAAPTGSSRSSARLIWPTRPRPRSSRRSGCGRGLSGRT